MHLTINYTKSRLGSQRKPDYRIKATHLVWLENLLGRMPHLFEIINPFLSNKYDMGKYGI